MIDGTDHVRKIRQLLALAADAGFIGEGLAASVNAARMMHRYGIEGVAQLQPETEHRGARHRSGFGCSVPHLFINDQPIQFPCEKCHRPVMMFEKYAAIHRPNGSWIHFHIDCAMELYPYRTS